MTEYIKIITDLNIQDKDKFKNYLKSYRNFDDINVDSIISACNSVAGFNIIEKKRRFHKPFLMRMIAYKLIREYTPLSLTDIGKKFGKHHTTVLYGINRFDTEIKYCRNFKNLHEQVTNILNLYENETI